MCFIIIVQLHMCVHLCVCSFMCVCVCVCVYVCMRHISDGVCTCISGTKNGCLSFILGSNRQTKIYCQFCVFAHTPNNATFYYFFTLRHNAAEYHYFARSYQNSKVKC